MIARESVRLLGVVRPSVLFDPVAEPAPARVQRLEGLDNDAPGQKMDDNVHCYVDIGVPAMLDISFHERSPPA